MENAILDLIKNEMNHEIHEILKVQLLEKKQKVAFARSWILPIKFHLMMSGLQHKYLVNSLISLSQLHTKEIC